MICFICKVKVENEEELYSHLQEVHSDYLKEIIREDYPDIPIKVLPVTPAEGALICAREL